MKILAFDLATRTGWCCMVDGVVYESGVQDFAKKRGESNGLLFMRARRWLRDLADLMKPDMLAYEQAHFRGGAATEICVGLQTRVQELGADLGIETAPVSTGALKKFATGNGAAGKSEMMSWAAAQLQRPPLDDNEADAVAVAFWAASTFA